MSCEPVRFPGAGTNGARQATHAMAGAMDSMAVHRARDAPHAPDNATRGQRTGAADHKDFVGVVQRVRDRERLQIDDADRAIIAARDQRGHGTPAPELTGANPVRAHERAHAHAHMRMHARTHARMHAHIRIHARTHSHELDRNGRDGPNRQVSLDLQCTSQLQPVRLLDTHRL